MYSIKTIINQQVNSYFGKVTKVESFNLYFFNEQFAIYVAILKDKPETIRVYIPLNGKKPFAINHELGKKFGYGEIK